MSNGGFGSGLSISSPPITGKGRYSSCRFFPMRKGSGVHSSHTSLRGSSQADRIQPHLSYSETPSHKQVPGPVGTLALKKDKWMIPLCHEPENDVETCCLGCWCPHILYGRTQYRLRQMAHNKDPLDLKDYNVINGPCATFMIVGSVTNFDWTFVMLQHSRVRATYNIEGTAADDCCSAYACPNCTLMQDDREIRAREYTDGKSKENAGTIVHQPKTEPDMQYTALNFFGDADQPLPHPETLVTEKTTTAVPVKDDDSKNPRPKSEKPHELEGSKKRHEHKKLHKNHKIDLPADKAKVNGKIACSNLESDVSNNRSSTADKPAEPDSEDKDATLGSKQIRRDQNQSGKQEGCIEHISVACPGERPRGIENHDSGKNRRTLFDYSEDASISQVRGKRVLKQLGKVDGHSTWSMAAGLSESPADESVLVYYDDGDHPQRHRLADCARLRTSTLSQPDTPHHNDLPAGWREEETTGTSGQSEVSEAFIVTECPEVIITEHLEALDPTHIFNEPTVQDTDNAASIIQRQNSSHSLNNCAIDNTSDVADAEERRSPSHSFEESTDEFAATTEELARPNGGNPESIQQHCLDYCAPDIITAVFNPEPAEEISQHHLAECAEIDSDPDRVVLSDLEQYQITDHGAVDDAQFAQPLALDQHKCTDCTTSDGAQCPQLRALDQHGSTDCTTVDDAQFSEPSCLNEHGLTGYTALKNAQYLEPPALDDQHKFTNYTIINKAQSSEAYDDRLYGLTTHSHMSSDHSIPNQAVEQSESRTVIITVPQPPVTVVTTTDVLEEASRDQHQHYRDGNKSSEIGTISADSETSVVNNAGPPEPIPNHDGPADPKDGQQQLNEAASALRKVLSAAAAVRHGKTNMESMINDPTMVDAGNVAKRSSRWSRSKAFGGRAQRSKGKF